MSKTVLLKLGMVAVSLLAGSAQARPTRNADMYVDINAQPTGMRLQDEGNRRFTLSGKVTGLNPLRQPGSRELGRLMFSLQSSRSSSNLGTVNIDLAPKIGTTHGQLVGWLTKAGLARVIQKTKDWTTFELATLAEQTGPIPTEWSPSSRSPRLGEVDAHGAGTRLRLSTSGPFVRIEGKRAGYDGDFIAHAAVSSDFAKPGLGKRMTVWVTADLTPYSGHRTAAKALAESGLVQIVKTDKTSTVVRVGPFGSVTK